MIHLLMSLAPSSFPHKAGPATGSALSSKKRTYPSSASRHSQEQCRLKKVPYPFPQLMSGSKSPKTQKTVDLTPHKNLGVFVGFLLSGVNILPI